MHLWFASVGGAVAIFIFCQVEAAGPKVPVAKRDSGKEKAVPQPKSPTVKEPPVGRGNVIRRFERVLRRRDAAKSKINEAINKFRKDMVPGEEKERVIEMEIELLSIYRNELSFNEDFLYQSVEWLEECSKTPNLRDYQQMSKCMEVRLNSLRDASFHAEEKFQSIQDADSKRIRFTNASAEGGGIINSVLSQLAVAADDLEYELGGQDFDHESLNKLKAKGENIETVVRTNSKLDSIIRLLDAKDNQYVLAKAADTTMPIEDEVLLLDIVSITIVSTALSYISTFISLPSMFGQLMGGLILGPSGINILVSLVQIETLAEFGVFFIMFSLGLEFSISHLRQVLKTSVVGSCGLTAIMILASLLLSMFIQTSTTAEACFIAACLSLSSTPLVIKLTSFKYSDKTSLDGSHSKTGPDIQELLLGILIMQDLLMGLLIAFLPALAGKESTLASLGMFFRVLVALAAVLVLSIILVICLKRLKHHIQMLPGELIGLSATALAFSLLAVTRYLGISMELGCFIAGSIISTVGHPIDGMVEQLVNPVKDFFSCIFFTAIGLHIFPSFVLVELGILALSTVAVVLFKFGASVILMRSCVGPASKRHAWLVAAGLSQVSEFSFVLGTRARHLGLISREVYLLTLSLCTLSLILSPGLWHIVSWGEAKRVPLHRQQSRDVDVINLLPDT